MGEKALKIQQLNRIKKEKVKKKGIHRDKNKSSSICI